MMVMSAVIIQLVNCILNFPCQLIGFVEEGKEFVFHTVGTMVSFVDFGKDFLQLFVDVSCFRQELIINEMNKFEANKMNKKACLFNNIIVKFFYISLDYVKIV